MNSPGEDFNEIDQESDQDSSLDSQLHFESTTTTTTTTTTNFNVTKKRKQINKTHGIKSNKSKKTNETMSPKTLSQLTPSPSTSDSASTSSSSTSVTTQKYPYCFLNSFNPYKRAYLIDYNVTRNWCVRPLPRAIHLKSHDEHVITCLKFDGRRVVSGSDDNTLKVWCAQTGKLLNTLIGHTGGVWASQLKDNIVISGSTDRTVRVWNIDTGECVHVLTGHTSTVRCLALNGSIVISGSRDSLLRVWNVETGQCTQVLRGHQAAVSISFGLYVI